MTDFELDNFEFLIHPKSELINHYDKFDASVIQVNDWFGGRFNGHDGELKISSDSAPSHSKTKFIAIENTMNIDLMNLLIHMDSLMNLQN